MGVRDDLGTEEKAVLAYLNICVKSAHVDVLVHL